MKRVLLAVVVAVACFVPTLAQSPTQIVPAFNVTFCPPPAGTFLPCSLFTSTTAASNGTTVETDLISYTMPASTLSVNNQKVRITVYGTAAANANTKTIKIYFGATVVTNLGTAINGVGWAATAVVARTGAATQVAGSVGVGANGTSLSSQSTAPTETLSGAVVIKVTGQSGAASADITATAMFVEWVP